MVSRRLLKYFLKLHQTAPTDKDVSGIGVPSYSRQEIFDISQKVWYNCSF